MKLTDEQGNEYKFDKTWNAPEIKKDMPKPRGVKTKSMLFVDTFQESYNRALEDCLAAIKHLLGDGE